MVVMISRSEKNYTEANGLSLFI